MLLRKVIKNWARSSNLSDVFNFSGVIIVEIWCLEGGVAPGVGKNRGCNSLK